MPRSRVKKPFHSENEPTNLERFLHNGSLDRRSRIIRAVCRLIETKGAMPTSVSDIAREAGMTVPHLLYYFSSKEALFDEVYNSFSASLLSNITSDWSAELSAGKRCQLLADNMFLESADPALDSAIIFEMIAYAVHSRGFRLTQQQHTDKVANYLKDFFAQTPRTADFSSEESAVIICSLWIGILIVSFFYRPMTRKRARELFRRTMLHFAGIDARDQSTIRSARKASRVKPNPARKRRYDLGASAAGA